ncbi:Dynamin superfamily [Parasponia andersonii]|uniref:Dynamin superfamily n=1 Tax=Parasponia andersonii TaxID=3476 RepID=A0A2P5DWW7_PARAD|nr:Dynamin superfamily [Parasponia andersonii]
MGSQLNHVGGGTKTWRPITLHMKYHPDCESPLYSLVSDSDPALANHKSLPEVQVLFCIFFG